MSLAIFKTLFAVAQTDSLAFHPGIELGRKDAKHHLYLVAGVAITAPGSREVHKILLHLDPLSLWTVVCREGHSQAFLGLTAAPHLECGAPLTHYSPITVSGMNGAGV